MAESLDLYQTLDCLSSRELNRFRAYLSDKNQAEFQPIPGGKLENNDVTDVVEKMKQFYTSEGSIKITLNILEKMKRHDLTDEIKRQLGTPDLQRFFSPAPRKKLDDAIPQIVKRQYQAKMVDWFDHIRECIEEKSETLLSKIYTELSITEGESEGVNTQHEVRRMEMQSKFPRRNRTKIICNDIFKCLTKHEKIRTVVTTGIAGIGKTVCVQKFILDWAEGTANQEVDFIFPLPFRDLNSKHRNSYSLQTLLLHFHPELIEVLHPNVLSKLKILFIFDGLDESKLSLNVEQNVYDPLEPVSLNVLISNLMKGNLLPKALIWITSRPAAVKQICSFVHINKWSELLGFNDQQKDEYFRNKIDDERKAERAINHIKSSKSLYIMCQIPVFCWMLATVFINISHQSTLPQTLPQTLTEIYIYFLLIETKRKNQKSGKSYEPDDKKLLESNRDIILKLSELAYRELEKGNILFYENNLSQCGIDVNDPSLYSGMCTEFFKSECDFYKSKVFCFVHLSIQEFLAAMFMFYAFVNGNTEVLQLFTSKRSEETNRALEGSMVFARTWRRMTACLRGDPHEASDEGRIAKNKREESSKRQHGQLSLAEFLQMAVDKSIQSENGHLDLFLRFLLGICLDSNQKLLQGLLTQTEPSSESIKETAQYIKGILSEDTKSPERCMNLLLCLLEMKDNSLHQEIQQYINSEQVLSPSQCSGLAYMLLVSDESLEEFDLTKYKTTSEGRKRLLHVLRNCRKARLVGCGVREEFCEVISSALQSENPLRFLDLSCNPLGCSGVELLSVGLKHANCRLETLRLVQCGVSEDGCESLIPAIEAENSLLRTLDLSSNPIRNAGVKVLAMGLKCCRLETLRLANCQLTSSACQSLASMLQLDISNLKELDLSNNDLTDSGAEELCVALGQVEKEEVDSKIDAALGQQSCVLEVLRLTDCKLTSSSCVTLAMVLQSETSHLKKLDLTNNDFTYYGAQQLWAAVGHQACKLEELRLHGCAISSWGVQSERDLSCNMQSECASLRELDLSSNPLRDAGVQHLFAGLKQAHFSLKTLRLAGCGLSGDCCGIVSSILQSEGSLLRELDLSSNPLKASGVKLMSPGLKNTNCRLETLRLADCQLTSGACQTLASVLQLDNRHLKELDLSNNDLTDSGAEELCFAVGHQSCKLEVLRLSGCLLSQKVYDLIVSALTCRPDSCMIELDLSYNHPGQSELQKLRLVELPSRGVKVNIENCGMEVYMRKGVKKYGCYLTLEINSAHSHVILSEGNRKVTHAKMEQPYLDHLERFLFWAQVMSRQPLIGRCYWECEWSGMEVDIGVAYVTMNRKQWLENSNKAWCLEYRNNMYLVRHRPIDTAISDPSSGSRRVGVYLDREAGTVSFYSVSSDTHTLTHLHTFRSVFTDEPLHAVFWVGPESSVCLV